jgi:hypothetical protein
LELWLRSRAEGYNLELNADDFYVNGVGKMVTVTPEEMADAREKRLILEAERNNKHDHGGKADDERYVSGIGKGKQEELQEECEEKVVRRWAS